MHYGSLVRMKWFVDTYLRPETCRLSVLDVGSYNVNGSYRGYFLPSRYAYTGLDIVSGPNVDIVPVSPYHWDEVASNSFDVVISGQALEHTEFFWLTIAEMARVLKPIGLMCIIVPHTIWTHRYPVDCWRFEADGMVALARWCQLEILHASANQAPEGEDWADPSGVTDSILVARKPYPWPGLLDTSLYRLEVPDMEALASFAVLDPISYRDIAFVAARTALVNYQTAIEHEAKHRCAL